MCKGIFKLGCIIIIILILTACVNTNINSSNTEKERNKTETIDNVPVSEETEIKVKAIACGNQFSLLLDEEGYVWSCGRNEWSILGNGTEGNQCTFSRVKNIKDITAISAGYLHSLALDKNGEVWSWGTNDRYGQLGDGTKEDRSTPVKVIKLTDVVAIDAEGDTSFALKKDGTVWAWGNNMYSQLGSYRDQEEIPEQITEL